MNLTQCHAHEDSLSRWWSICEDDWMSTWRRLTMNENLSLFTATRRTQARVSNTGQSSTAHTNKIFARSAAVGHRVRHSGSPDGLLIWGLSTPCNPNRPVRQAQQDVIQSGCSTRWPWEPSARQLEEACKGAPSPSPQGARSPHDGEGRRLHHLHHLEPPNQSDLPCYQASAPVETLKDCQTRPWLSWSRKLLF